MLSRLIYNFWGCGLEEKASLSDGTHWSSLEGNWTKPSCWLYPGQSSAQVWMLEVVNGDLITTSAQVYAWIIFCQVSNNVLLHWHLSNGIVLKFWKFSSYFLNYFSYTNIWNCNFKVVLLYLQCDAFCNDKFCNNWYSVFPTTMIATPLATTKLVRSQACATEQGEESLGHLLTSISSTRVSWLIHTILILRSLLDVIYVSKIEASFVSWLVPCPSFLFLWHVECMHGNLHSIMTNSSTIYAYSTTLSVLLQCNPKYIILTVIFHAPVLLYSDILECQSPNCKLWTVNCDYTECLKWWLHRKLQVWTPAVAVIYRYNVICWSIGS